MSDPAEALRAIPQVDALVREIPALESVGPVVARWLVRREVDAARARALAGGPAGDVRAAVEAVVEDLRRRRIRRAVNATGVILHTNLGRAPLGDEAARAVADGAGAAILEMDVATGARAMRAPVAPTLAAALVDAEDALVVNNNAAALLLALAALARDREVIVSRGELIEIGGEFRLPEVMEASGALLREVGTTNRTRARDYRAAITERTGLILKVHPSNYRIVGFAEQPSVPDLVEVAREAGVPVLFDVGSGVLRPEEGVLADEPDATSALASGCDLVCFSGDKLLGGPQAGILAGRGDLVERCRRDPLARAVRADKLTLAALEATLWSHARGERERIPAWRMMRAPVEEIERRARAIVEALPPGTARVEPGTAVAGGGSLPGQSIPSAVIVVPSDRPDALAARLRALEPPVVARVERGRLVLDLRTVDPGDDAVVGAALRAL